MSPGLLRGVIPILAMPFDTQERVDLDSLHQEVDFLIDTGVEVVGFGFASEAFRLTEAEHESAIRAVCEQAAGKAQVLVQVTAASIAVAVARARRAAELGAGLLMLPAPVLVQVDEDDQFEYFRTVAAATELPVVVQDAPAMTGTTMSAALLARLSTEVPQVVGLKIEALPSAQKIAAVAGLQSGQGGVLGGAGGVDFYHELERGASGTMPGAGLPEPFCDVLRLHCEGCRDQARLLFNRYLPLLALTQRSLDTFLWVHKEILRRRGVFAGAHLRRPHEPIADLLRADLDSLLSDLLPYPTPEQEKQP